MTSKQILMSHINLFVYDDDFKPCFGIAIPKEVTGERSKAMSAFANALIDTANGDLFILMGFLLEVCDRHISFKARHEGRATICYKFVLASHCKNPHLNALLTRYLEKVTEIEKNQ